MNIQKLIVLLAVLFLTKPCLSQLDAALEAPVVRTKNLEEYSLNKQDYGMTIGIEGTQKGRIWACWVGGGDSPDAFFLLASSDDKGKTWTAPRVVIDPHDAKFDAKRRTLIGNLWLDPQGRLWLFFDMSMEMFDGRAGVWYTRCDNPDAKRPKWTKPKRIWHGMSLNKPIVLHDGSWMLPVSLWTRGSISKPYKQKFKELDPYRMANVVLSKDKGKTWQRIGGARFPDPQFDEHNLVELHDGTIWMTARTKNGIWQSMSTDKGKTWSEPTKYLGHTSSRHFMRRLQSGRILLVKHGDINEQKQENYRSRLTAYISDDEGKTWKGGLLLDERSRVTYPDGFQASTGEIFISYDWERAKEGEILMSRFTEEDVLTREFKSEHAATKLLIAKPLGPKKTSNKKK